MSISVMFALIGLAILLWVVLLQKLKTKPWLVQGIVIEPGDSATLYPAKVIGLGVFLAVVTALFTLFAAAYHMRMAVPDWTHLPLPKILWVNTVLLTLSGAALQWAWFHVDRMPVIEELATPTEALAWRANLFNTRQGLMAGGCFALAFLVGQLLAWRQLDAIGFFFSCTPASAFFYLFTGLHGVHLLGGLVVLGRTTATVYRSDLTQPTPAAAKLFLSIKLCAVYWHYLLLIWLAIFALLLFT